MAPLPTCVVLLVLVAAGLALASSSTTAALLPEGKVRVTVRYADEEESRWLDRWAQTHQPLGSGGGRFRLTPASAEESAWLNRLSDRAAKGAREARDGDDGSHHHVEFDHDDPHGRVIQSFLSRLAKMREDLERAEAEEQKDTKDL
ncbi:unnamed protein product [Urochloa decumbens]|uniref:Uncharacterized protein n=1 Tax=Urochloa decumbens TaxID=240449 RepID=A0ABC8VZE7_9POAL